MTVHFLFISMIEKEKEVSLWRTFSHTPAIPAHRTTEIKLEETAGKLPVPEKNANWLILKNSRPMSLEGRRKKKIYECTNHLSALIMFRWRHDCAGQIIKEDIWEKKFQLPKKIGLNKRVEK